MPFPINRELDAQSLLDRPSDGFLNPLSIRLSPTLRRENRREVVVVEPFKAVFTLGQKRVAVIVPVGFVSDFASMPGPARLLISPFGSWAESSVLHDWLYALGPKGDAPARRLADELFRVSLSHQRVGQTLVTTMFEAVRKGGGRAFGRDTEMRFCDLNDACTVIAVQERDHFARTLALRDLAAPPPGQKGRGRNAAAKT